MASGQNNKFPDQAIYKMKKNGFYQDSIQSSIKEYKAAQTSDDRSTYLTLDFSEYNIPGKIDEYEKVWHNSPLSQGATATCWSFATTSFIESEIFRQTKTKIKLSEMYFVYWEYISRAEYFVDHRGDMYFGQGSEANAVTRIMKEYGALPASVYSGKLKGQRFYDHENLENEIKAYLNSVKQFNIWDKKAVTNNVKSILNHYMGEPPAYVKFKDKSYTPVSYLKEILKINPDDYYCFMSTKSKVYNQKGELEEPDNWWHNDDYYNVHLEDFVSLIENSLANGYSLSVCGDVSEPGYDRYAGVGVIPTFDIPPDLINEDSREYRINSGITTDDHCIHFVGSLEKDDNTWFLIKDSSSGGFDGPHKGYRFIREDYVRLKMLAVMAHKSAAKEILDKIIK